MAKSKLIARHYSCSLVKCTLCTLCTSFYLFAHFTRFLQCVFVSLHNICIVFLSELLSVFLSFGSAVFSALFRVIFSTSSPLFSTKMIKGQQVNQRFFHMKDFMKQKLWLAPWHFLLSVLNRGGGGGQLKIHSALDNL